MEPKIEQLENKIDMYWQGVKQMDQLAEKELQDEEIIFRNCIDIVD